VEQSEWVPQNATPINSVVRDPTREEGLNGEDNSQNNQQVVGGHSFSRHNLLDPNDDQQIIQQLDSGRTILHDSNDEGDLDGEDDSLEKQQGVGGDSLVVGTNDDQQTIQLDYSGSTTLHDSNDEQQDLNDEPLGGFIDGGSLEPINESPPVGPNADQHLPRADDSTDDSKMPLLFQDGTRRLIPRVNIRHRASLPVGVLGTNGLRMIATSLEARRRQDRCPRPATPDPRSRESLSTLASSNVEMDPTSILGFHFPDSHQVPRPTHDFSQFRNVDATHTAPAVVNASMINADGQTHANGQRH
jgi:hypothetical protein